MKKMCDMVPIEVVLEKLDVPIKELFTVDDINKAILKGNKCIDFVFKAITNKCIALKYKIERPGVIGFSDMTNTCLDGLITLAKKIMTYEFNKATPKLITMNKTVYTLDTLIYKIMNIIYLCLNHIPENNFNTFDWVLFRGSFMFVSLDISNRLLWNKSYHIQFILTVLKEINYNLDKYISKYLNIGDEDLSGFNLATKPFCYYVKGNICSLCTVNNIWSLIGVNSTSNVLVSSCSSSQHSSCTAEQEEW